MMILLPYRQKTITRAQMQWLADGEDMLRAIGVTMVCLECKTMMNAKFEADTIMLNCACSRRMYTQAYPGEIKER
jgi:hypothetical protein